MTATQKRIEASRAKETDNPVYKVPIRKGLKLMPYQVSGLDYMLATKSLRILVADDMGLGKTVEAISYLNYMLQSWCYFGNSFLIICPAVLKEQWKAELEKWLCNGVFKDGIAVLHSGEPFCIAPIVIINFELVSKFKKELDSYTWETLVIDEAHRLQNPKSLRTCSIFGGWYKDKKTGKRVKHKSLKFLSLLELTGTPMKNRPVNLWPHLKVLDPQKWNNNFLSFARKYCNARHTPFGLDTTGSSNEAELQDYLRSTFMLRRMKTEVLKQLPKKIVTWVPLTFGTVRSLALSNSYSYLEISGKIKFEEMAELRAATGEAKAKFATGFIREQLATYAKIVVFVQHREVAWRITGDSRWNSYDEPLAIHGGISPDLRQQYIESFRKPDGLPILVGTIDTIGEGYNFQHADIAVFVEFDWSSEKCRQAEDRLLRLGRTKPAEIFYLHLKGSIDDRIKAVMSGKKKSIKEALG